VPSELIGDLPRNPLEDAVTQQADSQGTYGVETAIGLRPGHPPAANGAIEQRQHLRTKQRRRQEFMFARGGDLAVSEVEGNVRTDHVPGHCRLLSLVAILFES
jgi:hypothetical protein